MSQTLSEFLHEYAVKYGDRVAAIRARREDWIDAVSRLTEQIRQWLREADKDGVLRIDEEERDAAEETLGRYDTTQLKVTLGGRQVLLRSMGRNTTARIDLGEAKNLQTQGRVDLTDGTTDCIMYRLLEGESERWIILDPRTREAAPLSRETFERAMLDLLR